MKAGGADSKRYRAVPSVSARIERGAALACRATLAGAALACRATLASTTVASGATLARGATLASRATLACGAVGRPARAAGRTA